MKKLEKVLLSVVALTLVAALSVAGTLAYLQDSTEEVQNTFETNQVKVELTEKHHADPFNIIPGTEEVKDPKVKVTNTIDCYVYIKVTDTTNPTGTKKLVKYDIANGWDPLEGYDNVYYREVKKLDTIKEFSVLAGDKVSYDPALTNADMEAAAGQELKLTFQAFAIQQESFDSPLSAYFMKNAVVNEDGSYTLSINNETVTVKKDATIEGLYKDTADENKYYAATPAAVNEVVGAGGNVTLMNNVNAGSQNGSFFAIGASTTIDGNGQVLTTSAPSGNGTRVIDVWNAGSDTITITNAVVTGNTTSGKPSYLQYGLGMWDSPSSTLNIEGSTVEAGHYALGIQGGNANAAVNITNTTLKGYCGFQTFSPNTNATFTNSHIIGLNQSSGSTDDFAAVCVMMDAGSSAKGSILTFNQCTIEATEQGTAKECLFSLRTDCTLNLNGCTFVKNGETVSTEDLISDIQNGTAQYVYLEPGITVSIFVDGVQVEMSPAAVE